MVNSVAMWVMKNRAYIDYLFFKLNNQINVDVKCLFYCKNYDFVPLPLPYCYRLVTVPLPSRYHFLVFVTKHDTQFIVITPSLTIPHRLAPIFNGNKWPLPFITVKTPFLVVFVTLFHDAI